MRHHSSRQIDPKIALGSFIKLIRAAETVIAEVHAELPAHNLTMSQFGVLEALYHLGPLCQTELAGKILKSTGNITMVIDNLEKQGLVLRVRNTADRRFIHIHLTAEGRKRISALFPEHINKVTEAMARLTQDEQILLGDLCRRFKDKVR